MAQEKKKFKVFKVITQDYGTHIVETREDNVSKGHRVFFTAAVSAKQAVARIKYRESVSDDYCEGPGYTRKTLWQAEEVVKG